MADINDILLSEMREIRADVGVIKETMARFDERLKSLEENPPVSERSPRSRTIARDGGLVISGATLVAVLQAVVPALVHMLGAK